MAKPKDTTNPHSPKPKTSVFLCCFGFSSHAKEPSTKGADSMVKMKKKKKKKKNTIISWFSWRRIRLNKNSAYRTVPLEASISDDHAHYSKSKSKSTLQHKPQALATNPPPPLSQPAPVLPGTPYYTPTQTRHGTNANKVEDTSQPRRTFPAHTKRQVQRLSLPSQMTPKKAKNTRSQSSYDPVIGMSVIVVTLVIMMLWGRLCAILCTSMWLYCVPRFRKSGVINDDHDLQVTKSNQVDLDLDSEEYKKKVIMEGLLGRNHKATL